MYLPESARLSFLPESPSRGTRARVRRARAHLAWYSSTCSCVGSGMGAEGQVFLGLLDFTYYTDPDGELDTTAVRQEVYGQTRLFEPTPGLFGQASFGHLDGYRAGYYGYLWSLVYAQDMFSRFEQAGIMNKDVAREYREKVLAKGGTRDAIDLVRDFLGREPNADAFLRHLGLER